jgi:hypothetical protein
MVCTGCPDFVISAFSYVFRLIRSYEEQQKVLEQIVDEVPKNWKCKRNMVERRKNYLNKTDPSQQNESHPTKNSIDKDVTEGKFCM